MNESSTQEAPPEHATPATAPEGETTGSPVSGAAAAAGSSTEPAPEPLLAPGVDRLDRPTGTSRAIPESMLGLRPSAAFLVVVSSVSFVADIASKLWAEAKLTGYPGYITLVEDHLMFVLAKNKGGAWGLLQGESENVRRPFFVLVSVAAITFIVTLYRRLQPQQRALKWGLPLVLGGALGNVFDRIRYGYVIDFIDVRADAIRKMNELIQKYAPSHIVTDHWPTFNVADIAICVGVGLMAVDMMTSRRDGAPARAADVPVEPAAEPTLAEGAAVTAGEGVAVTADGLAASADVAAPPSPPQA